MHRSYIVLYMIPGPNGSLELGERLFNFVWYTNMPEHSQEFVDAMTEIDGYRHRATLPIGKMRLSVWAAQEARGREVLPAPFQELVGKIEQPFITAVSDIASPQASFFDGKLLLVGDALSLFRPNIGASTN